MNMTFEDAQRFLLDKLDAADADNMIRFIRGQEAQIVEFSGMLRQFSSICKQQQELIDSGNQQFFELNNTANQFVEINKQLLARLKNNGWISVDERLPENFQNVMIVVVDDFSKKKQGVIVAHYLRSYVEPYTGDCSDFGVWDEETETTYCPEGWYADTAYIGDEHSNYFVDYRVTHWQPLPPAPEQPK